ncbi:hypothetical protein MHU86_1356 [Fragilaria crotonensis]|nr:hypothetical protein MHU86_1356 [Fragilaria crotonensis]
MEDESFEELIEELRELKIREADLTVKIERARLARAERANAATLQSNDNHTLPDGTLFFTNGFRQGDRVRITNKVRKPATAGPAWTEAQERSAVVTKVIPDQVHILTDNGTKTWRAPNNLKRVSGPH